MKTATFQVTTYLTIAILLAGCFHEGTTQPRDENGNVASRAINDTGVTQFMLDTTFPTRVGTTPAPSPVLSDIEPADMLGQDGRYGADVTQPYDQNGRKGFNFIKLDATGTPLADQSQTYDVTPWSCVLDAVTGLMWEVKTPGGVQGANNRYTWYDPNAETNGGNAGAMDGANCGFLAACNTHEYTQTMNALEGTGLCGYTDWRLPTKEELRSIIDYGVVSGNGAVLIDTNFFPYAVAADHWTSQTALVAQDNGQSAWEMHFQAGNADKHLKSAVDVTVRLVRTD